MTSGTIRILWDSAETAQVTITGGTWKVGGNPVTFPYALTASTSFVADNDCAGTVSVTLFGIEIASTPDGVRAFDVKQNTQMVFAPSIDSVPGGASGNAFLGNLDSITAGLVGDLASDTAKKLSKDFVSRRNFARPALGAVVFTYDDGKAICPTLATLHEARGQLATFAITSNWVNTAGYMTTAQVLDLFNRGHELANHSTDHLNYTTITAAQRAAQSDTCSDWIEALTGVRPVTMIPPQGGWDINCDREWHTRFRSVGLTASPTTNLPVAYPLGETAPRFYRITLDDPANLPRAMELVRLAAVSPIVVSFCAHNFDASGYMNLADYLPLLDLVEELNVPTLRAREAFGSMGLLANPSFEGDLGGWIDQSTAGGTIAQTTITPDAGISGTGGLLLTANGTTGQIALATQSIFSAASGATNFSGRVKVNSGGLITNDFKIRLRYRDWQDLAISQEEFFPTLSGTTWVRFDQAFTVPEGCKHISVDLACTPAASRTGSLVVDHVDLRPKRLGSLG